MAVAHASRSAGVGQLGAAFELGHAGLLPAEVAAGQADQWRITVTPDEQLLCLDPDDHHSRRLVPDGPSP